MKRIDQRIVMVVRKTRLDDLTAKFSTRGQARFKMARARVQQALAAEQDLSISAIQMLEKEALKDVERVESEADEYQEIVGRLRSELDFDLPVQVVDRSFMPNLSLGSRDVVVAVGQDGLVANVAKYAVELPIVGINPNRAKIDGVLLPFEWQQARSAVQRVLEGRARYREVTLAEAKMNDGQRLLAFNDFFVGARSHVSARYRLEVGKDAENQSSSGVLVSTGAGSTGWMSSVLNMVAGVMGKERVARPMRWEDRRLMYVVREPFVSKTSGARMVTGMIENDATMTVESHMGPEGTIFSDGVEADALAFGEGAIVSIGVAKERARLVVG